MKGTFQKIKEKFSGKIEVPDYSNEELCEDYVEIDSKKGISEKAKIIIRPFIVEDFSDIKPALDDLREGYTIALINIKPLKDKDLVELKRAINKLKKTCEAVEGDIAGFGEDWIVVTPSFAQVYRGGAHSKEISGSEE